MGRKAQYTKDDFLDAALAVLARGGPDRVTMQAAAQEAGAPIGSLYHRFKSREQLMAELWIREVECFQEAFLAVLDKGELKEAGLFAIRWVRERPNQARLLLLFRRDEFGSGDWPAELSVRALDLARSLERGFHRFALKLWGDDSPGRLSRLVFALADIPSAAVRRFLEMGRNPPDHLDDMVWRAVKAVLEDMP